MTFAHVEVAKNIKSVAVNKINIKKKETVAKTLYFATVSFFCYILSIIIAYLKRYPA